MLHVRPSILQLIDTAATIPLLEEAAKRAASAKDASAETRRRWADAVERRLFILQHTPKKFVPIPDPSPVHTDDNEN